MFHSIITILTTAAVALHAMLGCCAHHAHTCDSATAATPVEADNHCCHGHHHHQDGGGDSLSEDFADGGCCGGGDHQECDERDCSFASVRRSNDFEWLSTFSVWRPTLDAAHSDAANHQLSSRSPVETPPDPLLLSGSARPKTQNLRL